jgi:iron(III) transport system ATP-binding protein
MSLQLVSLTKTFESTSGAVVTAVSDVSLDIGNGTFCTLLGPSGCGKTTLLRLIAGLEQPTSGDIVHDGRSLRGVPPYRRGFPMVFQSYALFPHMTVFDNVAYGLRLQKAAAAETGTRVLRVLALLGLETLRARHPAQLSGGQQQRVALARCLVLEPQIILFDEPLSNLDAELRVAMRREIRALQQRLNLTAVYVTHDQEEALAVSDTIVVLDHGRVEQTGTPHDVFSRPRTSFVARFLGSPNIFELQPGTGRLTVLGSTYERRLPAGARHVVVRSDAIVLNEAGRHTAVVEERTYLGARVQYVLRLDGGEQVHLELPAADPAAGCAAGERVAFDLLPERLHFLEQ